jgi:hypothetical protein
MNLSHKLLLPALLFLSIVKLCKFGIVKWAFVVAIDILADVLGYQDSVVVGLEARVHFLFPLLLVFLCVFTLGFGVLNTPEEHDVAHDLGMLANDLFVLVFTEPG